MRNASLSLGEDRTYRALIAGLISTVLASIVLFGAYAASTALAPVVGSTFGRWLVNLTQNPATLLVQGGVARAALVNFVIGLLWALVYAFLAEPRLAGRGWQRGTLFALLPWVLSLVVFLPLIGAGWFGLAIGAGPLPILGNLILHLVYGAALGAVFALEVTGGALAGEDASSPSVLTNLLAERGMASGMVACGLGGAVLSVLGAAIAHGGSAAIWEAALAGAVFGAAAGALVGSFVGLSRAAAMGDTVAHLPRR